MKVNYRELHKEVLYTLRHAPGNINWATTNIETDMFIIASGIEVQTKE